MIFSSQKRKESKKMGKKMVVLMVSFLLAFAVIGTAMAQQQKAPETPKVVLDMVAKAKAAVKSVPAPEVMSVVEKKDKAILLDVRDPGEFAAGHLPGAVSVSRGLLEWRIWGAVPDQDAKIIVYCRTGGRAALATKVLNDMGYKNAVLAGIHYEEWVKAGNPVER
jgi:rhodanese-related sulfurtransferase